MKPTLKIRLLMAALIATPTVATASQCTPGMKSSIQADYRNSHHHIRHPPWHRPYYHPRHPEMYWRHNKYAGSGSHYQQDEKPATKTDAAASRDIIDTAIEAGTFNTLVGATKTAELAETHRDTGPYTVFAPNDEAFAQLTATIRAAIIADKTALAEPPNYHVVRGEGTAADVAGRNSASTLQGSNITTDNSDGIKGDGASVITTCIQATNGIIHVTDAVMIPNSEHRSYPDRLGDMTLMHRAGTSDRIIAEPAISRDTLYIQHPVGREKPDARKF